jgi:hypothetical protein
MTLLTLACEELECSYDTLELGVHIVHNHLGIAVLSLFRLLPVCAGHMCLQDGHEIPEEVDVDLMCVFRDAAERSGQERCWPVGFENPEVQHEQKLERFCLLSEIRMSASGLLTQSMQ